jgi:lysophospholipase L1-like esterase
VTKILAFGDSMTEGVDSPPLSLTADEWTLPLGPGRSQSYPFKLKALIDARYTSQTIAVYNGGFAGRQARDDRGRFSQALSEGKPDLVLLMEGANDFNGPLIGTEGINARVQAVVDALEDMVREAGARGIPVMIGTLPPQRENSPKGGGVEFIPRFNEAVRVMASKKGADIVDIGSLPLALIGSDGLHPTEAGYQRMAEIWFDAIKAKYERAPQ